MFSDVQRKFTSFSYLLPQTKITYSFSSTTRWIMENKSFLLVEPCSRVIYRVEIKLQFSFRKHISICTVCTVLIRLISAFLYDLWWTHGCSNSWEKSTASCTKMEWWSMTILPMGTPRAVDNMTSLFWRWHLRLVLVHALNLDWSNKNMQCNNK